MGGGKGATFICLGKDTYLLVPTNKIDAHEHLSLAAAKECLAHRFAPPPPASKGEMSAGDAANVCKRVSGGQQ